MRKVTIAIIDSGIDNRFKNQFKCKVSGIGVTLINNEIKLRIEKEQTLKSSIQSLEGNIKIDCEKMNATTVNSLEKTVNANQKMYSDFPILEEGNNNITWSLGSGASFTKIKIDYRMAVI